MISPEEYQALPIDRDMYWDVFAVGRAVAVNGAAKLAVWGVVDRAVNWAVWGAVSETVNGAVNGAFQRGFSRD